MDYRTGTYTLYADDTGAIVQIGFPLAPGATVLVPPTATRTLPFDAAANPVLSDVLRVGRADRVTLAADGTVAIDGVSIVLRTPSARRTADRAALASILAKLEADQAPTAAELRVLLRLLLAKFA